MTDAIPFDPRTLRDAFGRFMTGVVVVTARSADGTPIGFTANSFSSVSMDPPLLSVCPGKFLSTYQNLKEASHFGISILADSQEDISNVFARSKEDRFAKVPHHVDGNDVPLIDGAIATFSCQTHRWIDAGDHAILLGQITGFTQRPGDGLGYQNGGYFSLGRERRAAAPSAKHRVCGAIVEYGDQVLLEQGEDGLRPFQIDVSQGTSARKTLTEALENRGLAASLQQVYSVFDDPTEQCEYSYFLARCTAPSNGEGLVWMPRANLPQQQFASPTLATLLSRFAREAESRNFMLYLGDAEAGELHQMTDRST